MTHLLKKGTDAERRCRVVVDDSCNHSQSWRTATTVSVHADSANHEFNTSIREKKKRVFPRKKNQWSLDPRGTIPTLIVVYWKSFLLTNRHDENNNFFSNFFFLIYSFSFSYLLFLSHPIRVWSDIERDTPLLSIEAWQITEMDFPSSHKSIKSPKVILIFVIKL